MHNYVESIITEWNEFCDYINGLDLPQTAIPQQNTTNANFQIIMTVAKVIGKLLSNLANHTVTTDSTYETNAHFKVVEIVPDGGN